MILTTYHREFNYTYGIHISFQILEDFYSATATFDSFLNRISSYYKKILYPHRTTILHDYIKHFLSETIRDEIDVDYLIDERDPDEFEEIITDFVNSNGLIITGFKTPNYGGIISCRNCDEQNCQHCAGLRGYLDLVKEQFLSRIPTSVDAAFHILIYNKAFLADFHTKIAKKTQQVIEEMKKKFDTKYFNGDKIQRRRLGPWGLNAILYRDKGVCVICRNNISGMISSQVGIRHYDHIVPLDKYGCNDPTNFQLLCKPCNGIDGKGTNIETSRLEIPLWDDDSKDPFIDEAEE